MWGSLAYGEERWSINDELKYKIMLSCAVIAPLAVDFSLLRPFITHLFDGSRSDSINDVVIIASVILLSSTWGVFDLEIKFYSSKSLTRKLINSPVKRFKSSVIFCSSQNIVAITLSLSCWRSLVAKPRRRVVIKTMIIVSIHWLTRFYWFWTDWFNHHFVQLSMLLLKIFLLSCSIINWTWLAYLFRILSTFDKTSSAKVSSGFSEIPESWSFSEKISGYICTLSWSKSNVRRDPLSW